MDSENNGYFFILIAIPSYQGAVTKSICLRVISEGYYIGWTVKYIDTKI